MSRSPVDQHARRECCGLVGVMPARRVREPNKRRAPQPDVGLSGINKQKELQSESEAAASIDASCATESASAAALRSYCKTR